MRIGLRGGHSPNCKGAMSYLDEQKCMRELYFHVEDLLKKSGHEVIDCNSNASSASAELNEGVTIANKNKCDIFISLHMNAYKKDVARGVEAICYNSASTKVVPIGKRFCENISALGTTNRGVKYRTDLYELKYTSMNAIILEMLFCDNKLDVDIWNKNSWDTLARCVANAIDPNIPLKAPEKPNPPVSEGDTMYRVVCGSYSNKDNAEKKKRELEAQGHTGVFLMAYKNNS